MKRSPLDLAAVATAAVPGLSAASVGWLPDDREDFNSALVIDTNGGRWRVRSPKHADASLRLETELRALGGLSPAVRATYPFAVPSVAGTVRRGELKTFVYHHLDGHVLTLEELADPASTLPAAVGRAIAAIHATDRDTVERAGLPSDDAEEYRRARLSELDQVAASGKVPARLLRRWEAAMEDVSLWRFNPSVVHGDLHEEQLFVRDGALVAVTGWSDLHVGDPAQDLAWLLALDDQRLIDAIVEAYSSWRGDKADPHLMTRATLSAEFALARWLARAITRGDQARIAEAVGLLEELDQNLRELGEKPIGLVEAAQPGAAAGATDAASAAGEAAADAPSVSLLDDVDAQADGDAEADADESPEPDTGSGAEAGSGGDTEADAAQQTGLDSPEATDSTAAAEREAMPKVGDRDATGKGSDASVADATSEGSDAGVASETGEDDADETNEQDTEDDEDAVITDSDVVEPATEALPVLPAAADPEGDSASAGRDNTKQ